MNKVLHCLENIQSILGSTIKPTTLSVESDDTYVVSASSFIAKYFTNTIHNKEKWCKSSQDSSQRCLFLWKNPTGCTVHKRRAEK